MLKHEVFDLILSRINPMYFHALNPPEIHPNITFICTRRYPKLIKSKLLIWLKHSLQSWDVIRNEMEQSS
jgi:hypothetical protein